MGNSFFDQIGQVNPWKAPDAGAGPQDDQERSFFQALEALKAQRNAARTQTPQEDAGAPTLPPEAISPPDEPAVQPQGRSPEDVGHAEAAVKGVAGTATDMGSAMVKGAGMEAASHIDPWLERLARVSPAAQNVIYTLGLGDDTIEAQQTQRLAYSVGEATSPDADPRNSSTLYQLGEAVQRGGYSMFGIDPAVQQKNAYKVAGAITNAGLMLGAGVAAGVATGGVGAMATVGGMGYLMESGNAYDRARMEGANHDEAINHARRVGTVAAALEAVSVTPLLSAVGRSGRAAAAGGSKLGSRVGKSSFSDPVAKQLEKALAKRGISVRQRGVARGITAASAAGAEGGEEYLTGLYGDIDMKYLGKRWAPGKSWTDMLVGPERIEEFILGAIGGMSVGAVVGGRIQFTDERKQAAKQVVQEAAARRGDPFILTDTDLEAVFRRAEDKTSPYVGKDMRTIGEAINNLRTQAAESENIETDIELSMQADALMELYESAGVRAGRRAGLSPEDARQVVRELDVNELTSEEALVHEDAQAARLIKSRIETWGLPALDAFREGYRRVASKLSGGKKRAAEAINRAIQKVDKVEQLVAEQDTIEQAELEQAQQQSQALQAATADQLQRGATERLNNLRKKWANPEARRRAIQILLADHTQDVNEMDPSQPVPGILYTSAMLDMPIGVGPDPQMTVREAFVQEIQYMAEAQQMEYQEQMAELQDKQAKIELKNKQQEMQRQQQAFKDMFGQMKMQEQLRQWNAKVEQARLKELTDQEKLVETRRQMEQQKFEQEQKEREAAEEAARKEPVARVPLTPRTKTALEEAFAGEKFNKDDVRIEGNELLVTDPEYLDLIAERLENFNEENEQSEAVAAKAKEISETADKTRKKQEAKKKREAKKKAEAKEQRKQEKPKPTTKPARITETQDQGAIAVPLSVVELEGNTVTRVGNLLKRIGEATALPLHTRLLAKALSGMFARIGMPRLQVRTDTNSRFIYEHETLGFVAGTFQSNGGGVTIGAKVVDGNLQFPVDVLMHELMHAVTTEALTYVEAMREDGNKHNLRENKELEVLYDTMTALWKQAKKANKKRNRFFGGRHYGLENVHEFVAEAFTNRDFQEFLATVQTEHKSPEFNTGLWSQFKQAVFDFLGIENRHQNLLDSVFNATESVVEANVSENIDLLAAFPGETFSVAPMKSQHKGAWAQGTIKGEKVEIQQGPYVLNKKTGAKDTRWVTIRRHNPDGTFKKGVEKKKVKVTTLHKWLAASNGRPGTSLHQAFGLPAPPSPGTPNNPPPPPPPIDFNVKDPDAKRPGWMAWTGHLMRWGSQIEMAFGRVGQLLNRYGHEAGRVASAMKGHLKFNMDKAEEWSKKAFPTKYNRGFAGRISGPFKEYFGFLLSGKSIADELAKVGNDKWGRINEKFLREARAALGFDPADLYQNLNEAQAKQEIADAQAKAKKAKEEQERMYWERRAHYIETALKYHAEAAQKGELRIMHSIDSVVDSNLKFLLPPLMAARQAHDQAFIWREQLGLNPNDMVEHTQNHAYEGLSPDFYEKIKKDDPEFEAELASVAKEIYDESLKDPNLFQELGLNPNASLAELKKQVIAEARASLSQDTSSAFAKHSPKFGAFIKKRRGLYGIIAADWSLSGSFDYIDKAGRDISYQTMARDFWLTKKDTKGNPINPEDPRWKLAGDNWFFHGLKVDYKTMPDGSIEVQNKNIDDTLDEVIKQATQDNAFKGVMGYNSAVVRNYILHVRGREMKDGPARIASKLAKFQYLTKLGNFFTVATNMTVLFTLGTVLSPTNMMRTIWNTATNWNEYKLRAAKSGAIDPTSDPMAEFMSKGVKPGDSKLKRAALFTEMAMGLAFQSSETLIRTISANAAEAYFKANVDVLKDPSKAGIFKQFGISSAKEARRNLSDILGLTEAEINAIEKSATDPKALSPAQMEQLSLKAMYRGSNEINFKHGSQYVPQMFSRNNALSIFARVFRSFAYNVLAFKAKLFGKPLRDAVVEKDPKLAAVAALRMAKVYGGAFLTAQVLNEIAKTFKDDDDEDDLKGEGQAAKFFYNRLNDLNTVGMFGLLQDPLSLADPISFVGGVNFRTATNFVDYTQEGLMMPMEDFVKGRFGASFDQFMHANIKLLQKEVTHVRMLTDGHKKYFKDRKDYANARQVSRALYLNSMTTLEKVRYKKQRFQPSPYAKERDKVVNALAEGRYGDAMLARKEFIQRIMEREDDVALKDAISRARQSVMMKAPLSEWSRTTNPQQSSEQLMKLLKVAKDIKDRRGQDEVKRFAAAHLHYVRAVNTLFPSIGK